ncbi:MAG: hypothetical protein KAR06_04445 [Deltaproteobacteria bacterium]|nr:hypothetical protein [Deltaproteobacteria bacterium]
MKSLREAFPDMRLMDVGFATRRALGSNASRHTSASSQIWAIKHKGAVVEAYLQILKEKRERREKQRRRDRRLLCLSP